MDERNSNRPAQPDRAGFEHNGKERNGRRQHEAKEHDKEREKLDDALEIGLEGTFPGSDPVSVTQPPHSVRDKYEAQKR
jgi:hypothetical protein